ncbi:hypothetical protein [Halopseudomonas litoralis]|uniref:hypothetical protein n=1 Tax=Halopseudomonas litoralis TaxID=797277 RepID=UPI000B7DEAD5|nr:hypothetical protein [Halopseudomonas litoralis]
MSDEDMYRVYVLTCHFNALFEIFNKYDMYQSLRALGSRAGIEMIDHFKDGHFQSSVLRRTYERAMEACRRKAAEDSIPAALTA